MGLTWVNGFSPLPYGDPGLAVYTVPGTPVRLSLRREVAPLLLDLLRDWHAQVEPLDPKSCWGHAYREVRGATTTSFHAPGIAVDANASRHPLGTDPRKNYSAGQIERIHDLLARHAFEGRRVFRWGGDYTGRRDGMHVELILPRSVALRAVAARAAKPTAAMRASAPAEWKPRFPYQRGMPQNHGALLIQQMLNQHKIKVAADGVFGAGTEAAVRAFQSAHGLAADGVVGPKTWAALAGK